MKGEVRLVAISRVELAMGLGHMMERRWEQGITEEETPPTLTVKEPVVRDLRDRP